MMDLTKVDDIEFDGIDHKDYPDYSDAYISSASYNGEDMTEEQLEERGAETGLVVVYNKGRAAPTKIMANRTYLVIQHLLKLSILSIWFRCCLLLQCLQ